MDQPTEEQTSPDSPHPLQEDLDAIRKRLDRVEQVQKRVIIPRVDIIIRASGVQRRRRQPRAEQQQ